MLKFAAAALLLAATAQAKTFEGTVQYQGTDTDGKKGPIMELALKGDRMRVESTAGSHKAVSIMDMKNRKMTMLLPEQKQFMVHAMPEQEPEAGGKSKASLKKTGRTETIAGYKAEEWVWESEGKSATTWGTTELGAFVGGMSAGGRGHEKAIEIPAELKDKGFFPLRMVMSKGGKTGKLEAVSVKPGSLPNSLFEVPSGYKEMKGRGGMMVGGTEGAARMDKAMEGMSPEDRAMMEKMMKKMGHHAE